jgi:hypothetical protein
VAGDFRRFRLETGQIQSLETAKPIGKSPPLAGISLISWGSFPEGRTGWLTSEDSNSHIPNLKMPFEMSEEFPYFSSNPGLETFAAAS